jgi:hypothetical protein
MALELRGDFGARMLRLATKGSKNEPSRKCQAATVQLAAGKLNSALEYFGKTVFGWWIWFMSVL